MRRPCSAAERPPWRGSAHLRRNAAKSRRRPIPPAGRAILAQTLLRNHGVQHGHAHPQRAWERGLSMDASGGYAAIVVIIALIFIASMLS
jgi:hypothetical protein